MILKRYTLNDRPHPSEQSGPMRKKTTVVAWFISEPFQVDTQEGIMILSDETCDDFSGVYAGEPYRGYFLLYPSDGTKPYTNSVPFFLPNYTPVVTNPAYDGTLAGFLKTYGGGINKFSARPATT